MKIARFQGVNIPRYALTLFHDLQNIQVWRLQDFKICIFTLLQIPQDLEASRFQDLHFSFFICCKTFKAWKLQDFETSRFQDPHVFIIFLFFRGILQCEDCKISRLQDLKMWMFHLFIIFSIFKNEDCKIWRLQDLHVYFFTDLWICLRFQVSRFAFFHFSHALGL